MSGLVFENCSNDGVQRLKDIQRGTLNGTHTALTTTTFAQCWTLDPTGNWQGFRQDDDGNGTWELDQARTANTVNEITNITETAGPSWATPAYNRAGNMTTLPKPASPTGSYAATYDAWNRLVKLADGANTVSEYQYDGVKRRIVQKSYTAGTLSETLHLYYTQPSQWQVIEERLGTSPDSADPVSQTIWGLRYIDDYLLRDRDTDGNGTLNERLYALQDANWNVTSLADTGGTVQERYAYTPYGVPSCLTPSFAPRASSSYAWNTLYCGYRYEPATGLYHVRHRVLQPVLGVWVQRDPLGLAAGPNLYQYGHSIPIDNNDPLGLQERGRIPIPSPEPRPDLMPTPAETYDDCMRDCAEDYKITGLGIQVGLISCIAGCPNVCGWFFLCPPYYAKCVLLCIAGCFVLQIIAIRSREKRAWDCRQNCRARFPPREDMT
jgi:RHS repeat-associated protein